MKRYACLLLCSSLIAPIAAAEGTTRYIGSLEWQKSRLFDPNPNQLQQEARGRVFIYDGLEDTQVDQAMDQEFERIETMMFIRVRDARPKGNVIAYDIDDDC